jgi:hypothetical protein
MIIRPVPPEVPELDVMINKLPLVPLEEVPVTILIFPPVKLLDTLEEAPPIRFNSPPAPLKPLPTVT